jgi:hypothetical protein
MYPSDIRPLTSLRICAALWVLVYHFRNHLDLGLERFGLAAKGYLGVDLFFILSGFILSHVYTRAWAERRFNYGSFLWARLARLSRPSGHPGRDDRHLARGLEAGRPLRSPGVRPAHAPPAPVASACLGHDAHRAMELPLLVDLG